MCLIGSGDRETGRQTREENSETESVREREIEKERKVAREREIERGIERREKQEIATSHGGRGTFQQMIPAERKRAALHSCASHDLARHSGASNPPINHKNGSTVDAKVPPVLSSTAISEEDACINGDRY